MLPQVESFITKYNGKLVKSPHGILGQCVSVPSQFAVENGWPELFGPGDVNANAIWANSVGGYQKIGNTPAGYPSAGDFVFYSYDHVVLVESANANSIFAFEQNDPFGSTAHRKTYNYQNILGWFHHPTAPTAPQPSAPAGAGVYPVKTVVNVRTAPHVTAPIVAQLHVGSVQITGIVTGDSGTVGSHTSSQWGITLNGHYFNMAATQ